MAAPRPRVRPKPVETGRGPAPGTEAIAYRALERDDLMDVLAIERRSFGRPWDSSAFRAFCGPARAFSCVAVAAGRVVGYGLGWCAGGEAELMNLAVEPRRRGSGIGSELLRRSLLACAERGARDVFLEVRASNEAAQRIYRRHGFEVVGRRRGYYASPREDALVLRARLGPPDRGFELTVPGSPV